MKILTRLLQPLEMLFDSMIDITMLFMALEQFITDRKGIGKEDLPCFIYYQITYSHLIS